MVSALDTETLPVQPPVQPRGELYRAIASYLNGFFGDLPRCSGSSPEKYYGKYNLLKDFQTCLASWAAGPACAQS
jgi:hypothetical protein